jgi:hypothetical protein
MQWLGMGRVRVGFDFGGQIIYVHEFNNANNLTVPYMKTAHLPIRWEIKGNGVATMYATCGSVQSEGGADRHYSYQFSYNRAVITAGSGTQTYAFSIRPKLTFNSIVNRLFIRPTLFDCLVTGTPPVLTEIYYGTAVGGAPSWTDMNATFSALQVDTAGTPSGGLKVAQFWTPGTKDAGQQVRSTFSGRYPLTLDIAGTGYNHITVYVTGIGATSTCYPGLHWDEVR